MDAAADAATVVASDALSTEAAMAARLGRAKQAAGVGEGEGEGEAGGGEGEGRGGGG